MHKTRHFALDLKKDIRLSMTAGSKSDTGLFRAGYPRGVTYFSSDAVRIAKNQTGGADRDRTDDLRLAKPALSQLSYSPSLLSASAAELRNLASGPQSAKAWWA